jgi:asparagine synthase (glutamine-hydrolysing)
MCGITGMAFDAAHEAVAPERLLEMCRALRHRGPDDEGIYLNGGAGLAVRRLAVVDVAGGHQPVRNEAGTVHVVFNGEIYNHVELRRQLTRRGHRFASAADSEVIPHLYEEHGPDFPRWLDGMFAIALWDESLRQLVLCRDRLGIKPLYYAAAGDRVVFGSEIGAILAAGITTTLNVQAVSDYLSLMYVPGPHSVYREVRKLEPGTTLVRRGGTQAIRRYWDLSAVRPRRDLSARAAGDMLRDLLTESVERHLMSDVPLGFFLSGGMDSSSVVAAARQSQPDAVLKTFTVGFADPSYDERDEAARVARHLRTDHTELVVEPRPADVADKIVPIFDEPFADPSMVPTYYLCELARQQVTVALNGDGGDELFAGYLSYRADKLARHYRRLPRTVTGRLAPALLHLIPTTHARSVLDFKARRFVESALDDPCRSHYLWRVVFRENHKAELLHPELMAELVDSYRTHEPHDRAGSNFDPLTRSQYTDANVYLVDDVLTKADRVSMAHSLEVRVPLLATALAEFAFSLPGPLKMPGYQTKRLLRQAMADALPARTASMRKKGFNAPLARWLAGPFLPLVREYLSRDVLRRQGFLRFEQVDRLVRQHLDGVAEHGREIWTLLMFTVWAEQHKVQG